MRALAVEVSDIVGENAPEMTLAEHKHVVEAFAADAESIKNRGQRSICLGSVAASSLPVLDARSSTARSHGASLRAAPGFLCSRHGADPGFHERFQHLIESGRVQVGLDPLHSRLVGRNRAARQAIVVGACHELAASVPSRQREGVARCARCTKTRRVCTARGLGPSTNQRESDGHRRGRRGTMSQPKIREPDRQCRFRRPAVAGADRYDLVTPRLRRYVRCCVKSIASCRRRTSRTMPPSATT